MIKKSGFTLVEFIVAVSIFIIVMTVAIGSFISVSKLKILINNMKNTQQKTRTAIENVSRYAKEASALDVSDELLDSGGNSYNPKVYKTITLTYNNSVVNFSKKVIKIDGNSLYVCDNSCAADGSNWYYLLGNGSTVLDTTKLNYFLKRGNTTSDLEVNLNAKTSVGGGAFDDGINLDQVIILESLGK